MNPELLKLLRLSDLTLPVGGFSHSASLETYVQQGRVFDAVSAGLFIRQMIWQNFRYNEGYYFLQAWNAATASNWDAVRVTDRKCTAGKLAFEARQASLKMGHRLLQIFVKELSADNGLKEYQAQVTAQREWMGNYAVVFAVLAARMQIGAEPALQGWLYNSISGMVTNAVKLIPLGQQQGQELLALLIPEIGELVTAIALVDEVSSGKSCAGFDLRSMQHETLYTRLYMS